MNINGNNAQDYKFDAHKYFSQAMVNKGILTLSDGMKITLSEDHMFGLQEFKRLVALINSIL